MSAGGPEHAGGAGGHPGTTLRWGSVTTAGRVRGYNQDAVLAAGHVFAVADGMGGHAAGDIASRTALDTFAVTLPADAGIDVLVEAFRAANSAVIAAAAGNADLRGMGTTLCALALVRMGHQERLAVANVGDSRAYVVQDGRLLQVSRDHSYVEDLVALGRLTHEEARTHPQKNIVTRALGIEPDVQVDVWEVLPYTGDRYLLCSDGLTNEVPDDLIREVLVAVSDPQEAAERLSRMADEAGGRDNISVIVVDVLTAPPMDEPDQPAAASGAALPGPDTTVTLSSLGGWLPDAPELDDTAPPDRPAPVGVVVAGAPSFPVVASDLRPPRSPWRTLLFVLLLLGVVAAALGAVAYSARNVYTLRLKGDAIILEQGRSLLWFEPTLEKTYGLTRAGIPPARVADLEAGVRVNSVAEADRRVRNLEEEAASITTVPATTVPATTVPATTVPATTVPATTTSAGTLPPTSGP